jgi:hypothetical protein
MVAMLVQTLERFLVIPAVSWRRIDEYRRPSAVPLHSMQPLAHSLHAPELLALPITVVPVITGRWLRLENDDRLIPENQTLGE